MQAKHLTLLWAFASGGLSSALVLGSWRDTDSSVPVAQSRVDAAKPERAPVRGEVQDRARTGPSSSPASDSARDDEPAPPESGSSVADVLSRLEAAYQKELGVKEPVAERPPAAEPASPESVSSVQPELDARSESSPPRESDVQAVSVAATETTAATTPTRPEPVLAQAARVTPTPTDDHAARADARTAREDAAPIVSAAETARSAAALTATDDDAVAQLPPGPGTAVTASAFERPDVYQLQQLLLLQYIQLVVLPPGEGRPATRPHRTPRWPHTTHATPRALPWGHPTFPPSTSFPGVTNPWQQTRR